MTLKIELNNRNHSGVMTSPVARSAVLSIMLIAEKILNRPNQKMKLAARVVVSSSSPKMPAIDSGANSIGILNSAASATDITMDVHVTISACLNCCAPQLRATIAVLATDTPIRMA